MHRFFSLRMYLLCSLSILVFSDSGRIFRTWDLLCSAPCLSHSDKPYFLQVSPEFILSGAPSFFVFFVDILLRTTSDADRFHHTVLMW
jgi:hypothetical protein